METESDIKKKETIWSFPFVALMFVNFAQNIAANMSNTIIPLYLDHLGAAASIIGICVGSFAVTALIIRPFSGPAFDSFPRKRLLIIAQTIASISMLSYGFVQEVPLYIAVRMLHGIGMGCIGPLCFTLVSTFLPLSKMASGISIYMLAQSMAQVVGPATGLYLYEAIGFQNTFFLCTGLILVAMVLVFTIKEKPFNRMPYQLRLDRMFTHEAFEAAIVLMLLVAAFLTINSYLVLYSQSLGVEGIGSYFVVYALCLLATRPLYGKLADRFGAPKIILVGIIIYAIAFVMIGMARTLPDFIAAAVVNSLGFGASTPLIHSLPLARTPIERRGATSNTTFTGCDIGNLLGPTIAGISISVLQSTTGSLTLAYSYTWFVMIVPIAIALIFVIRWIRRE